MFRRDRRCATGLTGMEEPMNSSPTPTPNPPAPHFECPDCGEGFLSRIELNAHRARHPGPHPRPPSTAKKAGATHLDAMFQHESQGYRESGR